MVSVTFAHRRETLRYDASPLGPIGLSEGSNIAQTTPSNKTVQGISNHVLPAKSEHALNKFLTEYDWDENQPNRERLKLLQQVNETRWSSEGVVIIDDTFTHKVGKHIPYAGKFYDYTVPEYIWGQNLIYALYADEKTILKDRGIDKFLVD